MVRRLLLTAAIVLFAATPAFAQLDPETKQPYHWRVVLSAKPHPLITTDFRERVRRDIIAALQTGIGPLGTVEVFDLADHHRDPDPLWSDFATRGFAALDAPRDLTGAKTHFLRIEYRDGQFHLETRQYDGFTGLSSPLVRTRSIRAADQVGRAAGLLVDRDFGLTGTVEPIPGDPKTVKVIVRGSALGPVTGLVQQGDVFAVASVRKTNRPAPPPVRTATGKIVAAPTTAEPPGYTSTPRQYLILKVIDVAADGPRCTVMYADPARAMPLTGGVVGYRAMKLGTVKAPVAVRLVGADGTVERTAGRVAVRANDAAFPNPTTPDPKDTCSFHAPTAQFRTNREMSNVACVTVTLGATSKAFAVPVMSADPITLPFEVDQAKADKADYERAVGALVAAAADARQAQKVCFDAVAQLSEKQKNAEALTRARGGVQAADNAYASRNDELNQLREQLGKSDGMAQQLDKAKSDLDALKKYNDQLKEYVGKLEEVVKRENDPTIAAKEVQAQAINARIAVLLSGGDVDQALAAYDQLLALVPDAGKKAERDKIAAEWKVKNDEHQKARDYLTKTWPAVATIQDFKDAVVKQNDRDGPLRAALDVCKKNGDKWTIRKVLVGFTAAGVKLNELVASLDASTEADKKLAADATNVGKTLAAIEQELRAFIE